jgi:nickel superoxide dismutase
MTKLSLITASALFALALLAERASAHCQIPCGIYDDAARVAQIREDITTIEKSVKLINELAGKSDAQSRNQLTRWVMNKEHHAEKIIRTVSDYFLAQKIKPVSKNDKKVYWAYLDQLVRHHAVIAAAMKCKQSADPASVKALAQAVGGIAKFWK